MPKKAKKSLPDVWDGIFDDPEPDDLNDPEFRDYQFGLYQVEGLKPEDVAEGERELYAEWLNSHQEEE